MSTFLLDVNVLIALIWPAHESHTAVQNWFARNARQGWATCPLTEAGFVRIVTNPAFSRDAVSPEEGISVLEANLQHRSHRFWSDEIGLAEALEPFRSKIVGHRQITDAYLLGLAIHKHGKLATLERSIVALLPEDSSSVSYVEVIVG